MGNDCAGETGLTAKLALVAAATVVFAGGIVLAAWAAGPAQTQAPPGVAAGVRGGFHQTECVVDRGS